MVGEISLPGRNPAIYSPARIRRLLSPDKKTKTEALLSLLQAESRNLVSTGIILSGMAASASQTEFEVTAGLYWSRLGIGFPECTDERRLFFPVASKEKETFHS
ncbi:hypothetical protein SADUNF_Sadunf09G0046100 [Salix dunnii]|uniref:Uncharacterized protein n=1 Tax=Salix dunnii TaxID=1413687 RepID=A0A835JQK3_9ROSI|nr:hypothetical protein SADUNF_Sadunf09G0046100 [Salix dunnii]